MILLETLDVNSYDLESLDLTWSFKSTPSANFADFKLDVYRCEAPSSDISEYDLIASGISSTAYSYSDTTVSGLQHPQRLWYYKFKIKEYSGATVVDTDIQPAVPAYIHDLTDDKFHREILRRKNLVLNRYSGRTMKLIKHRSWGQHCPECWDEYLYRIKYDECPTCYGTGWVGGYFDPIEFKSLITPSPKYNQINMFGDWRPSDTMLTTVNFPPLQVRDVVVDERNARWMVKAVRTKEIKGFVIEQNIQASLISLEDDVYEVSTQ